MRSVLLIAGGGACGALARYGVALLMQRLFGTRFPFGTLAANLTGCLLIGIAFALATERAVLSPGSRLALMVGFLGAFTTFSTYALESVNLARTGEYGLLIGNLLLNNVGGAVLVLFGYWLGRAL